MTDLNEIRKHLRRQRRAIPDIERERANQAIAQRVSGYHRFRAARRIAAYLDFDGEVSADAIIQRCWHMGRTVYLPVLLDREQMLFAPFHAQSVLAANRFGILEPVVASRQLVSASQLDLVLTPLVGFDREGNRLGVGGGFYDRHFARHKHHSRPHLVGLAYACQEAALPPPRAWDVPLRAVITENTIHRFS